MCVGGGGQALMFWVVDNFLMKKSRTKAKLEEREVGEDSRGSSKVRYRRALSHDDSESEVRTRTKKFNSTGVSNRLKLEVLVQMLS